MATAPEVKPLPSYRACDFVSGWRRPLGSGAFSNVFNIKSVKDGNVITLKLYKTGGDDIYQNSRMRELRILSSIGATCPEILELKGLYMSKSSNLIAGLLFENAELGNWHDFLVKYGPLVLQRGENLFEVKCSQSMNVAAALRFLKSQKIVHGDVAVQNILIFRSGLKAKLCDFGAANWSDKPDETVIPLTKRGRVEYLAPERLLNPDTRSTHLTDIYAFGVLLFNVFAGTLDPWSCCVDVNQEQKLKLKTPEEWNRFQDSVKVILAHIFDGLEPAAEGQEIISLVCSCTDFSPAMRPDITRVEGRLNSLVGGMRDRLKRRKLCVKQIVDRELISRSDSIPLMSGTPDTVPRSRSTASVDGLSLGSPSGMHNLSLLLPSPMQMRELQMLGAQNYGIDLLLAERATTPGQMNSASIDDTKHRREDIDIDDLKDPEVKPTESMIRAIMHNNDIQMKWRTVMLELGLRAIDLDMVKQYGDRQISQTGIVDLPSQVYYAFDTMWLERNYESASKRKLLKALVAAGCYDSAHTILYLPEDLD